MGARIIPEKINVSVLIEDVATRKYISLWKTRSVMIVG